MAGAEWLLLLVLSVLWGGSFFFVEVAVRELPPLTIVVARVSLGACTLLVAGRLMGIRLPTDPQLWGTFVVIGLLNNVIPFTLIVWGQTHIASGVASILNATTPLFTVAVAHILTEDEKLTGGRLVGVILGLLGVAAMVGLATIQSMGLQVAAQLAILSAACSYAFAGVFGRRFKAAGIPPLTTATGQVTASSLLLLPAAMLIDRPWQLPMPSNGVVASVVGLAVLSTAVAYTIYFRILASAGATNLLLVTFLIPATAILLGVLALGETLLPRHALGMLLIGAGLAAIDGRPWRRLRGRRSCRRPVLGAAPTPGPISDGAAVVGPRCAPTCSPTSRPGKEPGTQPRAR
jgi:drug/metabolite transporter (DMT)-like permease